jgi:hypothetical protein
MSNPNVPQNPVIVIQVEKRKGFSLYSMKAENPYEKLFQLILPEDIALFFDLVDVTEKVVADKRELHLHLDEKLVVPADYRSSDLSPNGFYEVGSIQDFPIRDRRVQLPVCRRRRLDQSTGKSVSKDRDLVARGTRHSKAFAAFFKGLPEEIPDYGSLS